MKYMKNINNRYLNPDPFFFNVDPRIRIRIQLRKGGSEDPNPRKNEMDPKGWKKVQEQNYANNQAIVQVLRKKVIDQEKSKFTEEKKKQEKRYRPCNLLN